MRRAGRRLYGTDMSEHADDTQPILYLLRFSGDITTKAPPTRRRFVKRMLANVRDALRSVGADFTVTRTHNRIFVSVSDASHADVLTRVFGVQSLARVEAYDWRDLDDIVRAGVEFFGPRVAGRTFAVRARRVGERRDIPIRSDLVQRELGAALAPGAAGVDLGNPDVTASLEIMPGRIYLFHADTQGPAGLPLACEGNAVALVSGAAIRASPYFVRLRTPQGQRDSVFALAAEADLVTKIGVKR